MFRCGETRHVICACPAKLNKPDKSQPQADGEKKDHVRDEEMQNTTSVLHTVVELPGTSSVQKPV